MTPTKYLGVLAAGVLALLLIVFGVLFIGDPFGVAPLHRTAKDGDGIVRWARNQNDRLIKPYDPLVRPAQVIFLGSSHVKQGIDPTDVEVLAGGPVYNGGVDNGSLMESARFAELYSGHVRGLRRLYVEIFIVNELLPSSPHLESIAFRDHADNFSRLFLSTSALAAAVESRYMTLIARQGEPIPPITRLDGFYPVPRHLHAKMTFDAWLDGQWRDMRFDFVASDDLVPFLRLIRERAARHGVEVIYFVAPMHSWVLYSFEQYGSWATLEKVKRELARLGRTYDFMRYNEIVDEPPQDQMRYWFETWHFQPETGKLIAAAMIDRSRVVVPSNFGVLLAPETIEKDLAAFRQERDEWVKKNAAVVARYKVTAAAK